MRKPESLISSSHSSKEKPLGRLALKGVTVRFGEKPALDGVTFEAEPGEQVAVIGASGAGKSTLFRVLTRSVGLSSGRVAVGGRDLYALSNKELSGVRRCIGTIYQAYNLIPQLRAGVNAALGEVGSMSSLKTLRTFLFGPNGELAARVEAALNRVGLEDYARALTANLSGGQQQRVAVARLLVQRPDLILADEPFAAVDPVTTKRIMETLLELSGEGATLLVNLHDVRMARRFPRVVALREGHVAFDGPPDRLTEERLGWIYAVDQHAMAASHIGASPEPQYDVRPRTEEPGRLMEGRDGISAH